INKENETMTTKAETIVNSSSNLILGDNKPIITEKLGSASVSSINEEDIKVIRDIFGNEARFTPVNDKRPYQNQWQNNPKTIDYCLSCWESDSNCNGLGIITGNGYLAIDFDGNNAWELIKEIGLEELAQVETTAWSSGKEGRQQKLFKIPEVRLNDFSGLTKKAITSYQNISQVEKEQLEIRFERMQSVFPPSVHPETGKYHWLNTSEPVVLSNEQCDRILELFKENKTGTAKTKKEITKVNKNPDKVPDLVVVLNELGYDIPQNSYHYQALENEYLKIANLSDGRNCELNTAGFNLGQLINEGLERELIELVLIQASIINGKYDENKTSVENTIKSGIEAGINNPR
ncbi:MAG: hypothetical protein D6822_00215, partial [Cyanobacteria bacterium J149]